MRGKVAKAIRRAVRASEIDPKGRRYTAKPAGIRVGDAPKFDKDGKPLLPVVTVHTISLNPESGRSLYKTWKQATRADRRKRRTHVV